MAFTTSKMGLRIWNLLTDLYDHAQLADNWAKVDYHDHSPGKGVQITTDGLADGAVTGAKLAALSDPTGAYTMWYNVLDQSGQIVAGTTAATRYFDGTSIVADTAYTGKGLIYFDPADFVITGRTTKLRVKVSLFTNAVAPTGNFTVALFKVGSVAGGSGLNVPGTITTVSSSDILFTAPALSTQFHGESLSFDAPAAGYYMMGVTNTATTAASSTVAIHSTLQVRRV